MPSGFNWIDDAHFTYSKDGKKWFFDAKNNTEREATDADKKVETKKEVIEVK